MKVEKRSLLTTPSREVSLLTQKWDRLPGVQYANTHTEQRGCLYCILVQTWALGGNSTKRAPRLAQSQRLYTLTKTKKLLAAFWLVHRVARSSWKQTPSLLHCARPQAGGVQSSWFWIESVVAISPCRLYLFPGYPRSLLTSCFLGIRPAFGTFRAGWSPCISLLAPLQGQDC